MAMNEGDLPALKTLLNVSSLFLLKIFSLNFKVAMQ